MALELISLPVTVGRRAKLLGGGGALWTEYVGVLSSLLYPDSDSDSAVDCAADDTIEADLSFRVTVEAESVLTSSGIVSCTLVEWPDCRCTEVEIESSNVFPDSIAGVVGKLLSSTVSNAVLELLLGVRMPIVSISSGWSLPSRGRGRAIGGAETSSFFRDSEPVCRG
jgi:hypothetical protein